MKHTPNKYMTAIYDHVQHNQSHLLVDAVAGSGKTTTIVEALELIPMEAQVLFVAFNRHIAQELKSRVPFNVEASTLNSLGNGIVRNAMGYRKLKETKTEDILWFDIFGGDRRRRRDYYKARNAVKRLVSLFKSYAITEPTLDDCEFLDDRYALLTEEENGEYTLAIQVHAKGMKKKIIDFDDQIFYPVAFDLSCPKYDFVFVDESQDLNPAQVELIKRCTDGMIVAVGDTHQAIYGFRGADPKAMSNMAKSLKMERLPLSVCYRCAKQIVIAAQEEVPHIEYHEKATEGRVRRLPQPQLMDVVLPGDFILCRTTAPLVEYALYLIRAGRKAYVRGRDFGQNLLALLDHLFDLDEYEERVQKTLRKRPAALLATQDQIDTMRVFIEVCGQNERAIRKRIQDIFENDSDGIMLSTVHRCKGLETNRVFLLRPDLIPHPKAKQEWMIEQEHNLKYIAITRAKKEFVYVDNTTPNFEPNLNDYQGE